jgi:predicted nucleic acid-binding protein
MTTAKQWNNSQLGSMCCHSRPRRHFTTVKVRAALEAAGRPIGAHDMLIAAHARSPRMIVVTNNLHGFERIPGLRTEN